jgi:hypothetical protein
MPFESNLSNTLKTMSWKPQIESTKQAIQNNL